MRKVCLALIPFLAFAVRSFPQATPQAPNEAANRPASGGAELSRSYLLGPDDQIMIRAVEAEEISEKPMRIGMDGYIRLPMIGRFRAGGLTIEELESGLIAQLRPYIRDPEVSVIVTEFRSQPVSVIGSVRNPGVHQLQGRKTLVEMLSMAGGLSEDAGPMVKVTRALEWGAIPVTGATEDPTGKFSIAEIRVKAILGASNPEQNIVIRPNDVIAVPRAEMIYVTGQVVRSGGFVLNERESMTVLQALALAGGPDRTASPQNARILRPARGAAGREEIPVNVKAILQSKSEDVSLKPDDILFIPSNVPTRAAIRALETAIQIGTGIVIWRR